MSLEFHRMCRTCLSTGPALLSLFENKSSTQLSATGTLSIADMLKAITSVVITDGDGLPGKVCLSCISEINRAFTFKIKCENSEFTLKQYLMQQIDQIENDNQIDTESKPPVESLNFECSQLEDKNSSLKDADEEGEEEALSQEIPNRKESIDDDQVSLIFADVEDFEDRHQNGAEKEDEEMFSIDAIEEDNAPQDNEEVAEKILLECGVCNQKFEDSTSFQCHAEQCTIENDRFLEETKDKDKSKKEKEPLKCPHCPIDFVHPKNLHKHIKKCHERASSDEEDIEEGVDISDTENAVKDEGNVAEISVDVTNMVEEVKHHPAELPESPYKCMQCGAGFAKEKSLNYHFKLNKCTEKQFECLVCRRVFISKGSLVHHMKGHTMFKCGKCGKVFSRKDKLKAHNDVDHNGIIKNQCSLCGKVFTMLSTLKDHLRTHSGEKPFLCSICGKGFSQSTNLKQHLMRHSKIKPYKCDQCDNSFVSKGELNAHIRKHTGDHPFRCSTCGAGFTTSSSLVKHRRIHTGERPYACEFCPMRFSALGTLKNHRRTHTGEKPFVCKYCDRAFAQKSDCVTHMRTHTGERPYMCTYCGLSFSKSSAMKAHMQNHMKEDGEDDVCDLTDSPVYHTPDELKGEILQR